MGVLQAEFRIRVEINQIRILPKRKKRIRIRRYKSQLLVSFPENLIMKRSISVNKLEFDTLGMDPDVLTGSRKTRSGSETLIGRIWYSVNGTRLCVGMSKLCRFLTRTMKFETALVQTFPAPVKSTIR